MTTPQIPWPPVTLREHLEALAQMLTNAPTIKREQPPRPVSVAPRVSF